MDEHRYEPASYTGRLARRLSEGATAGRAGSFRPLVERRHTGSTLGIVQVEQALFLECLGSALGAGLGVLLAPTSDGGALSITVYDGDERYRTYCKDADEFTEALIALRARTGAKANPSGHTPGKRG